MERVRTEREELELYLSIGRLMLERPEVANDRTLPRLAKDLAAGHPDQAVWTVRDLRLMRVAASKFQGVDELVASISASTWTDVASRLEMGITSSSGEPR